MKPLYDLIDSETGATLWSGTREEFEKVNGGTAMPTKETTYTAQTMPLQVDRMPISWRCETKNSPTVTGRRTWGDKIGEHMWTIERRIDALCLVHEYDGHTAKTVYGQPLWHSDRVAQLVALAEWHEAQMFNQAQSEAFYALPPPPSATREVAK